MDGSVEEEDRKTASRNHRTSSGSISIVHEIQHSGPVRGNWKNYGKLSATKHHCHLKAGRPTYVACWEVTNKQIDLVEVYYVGTHEKALY